MRYRVLYALLLFGLLGCGQPEGSGEAQPPPRALTRDAVGHYCRMTVVDHLGPKGQILLRGSDGSVWFTSVRDAIAFTLLPEEPRNIAAFYVTDMGRTDWDSPGTEVWIAAAAAWYVIDSTRRGGMGAPEAVPFAEEGQARAFVARHGGRLLRLQDIPPDYVLGAMQAAAPAAPGEGGKP